MKMSGRERKAHVIGEKEKRGVGLFPGGTLRLL